MPWMQEVTSSPGRTLAELKETTLDKTIYMKSLSVVLEPMDTDDDDDAVNMFVKLCS